MEVGQAAMFLLSCLPKGIWAASPVSSLTGAAAMSLLQWKKHRKSHLFGGARYLERALRIMDPVAFPPFSSHFGLLQNDYFINIK